MDILMASPELAPFAKVGTLADSVAALSKTLSRLDHRVTVALPRYRLLDDAGLMMARRLNPLRVDVGDRQVEATLFDTRLSAGVELLLLDMPGLFDRPGIYGEGGEDYPDNTERFGLFCRALAELVARKEQAGTPFDAVHVHGETTALLAALLAGESVRTVLTVHDASSSHGRFGQSAIEAIGLVGPRAGGGEVAEWARVDGRVDLLAAGLRAADVVTTVSPTYRRELCSPEVGGGLERLFLERGDSLHGILDGIDYATWSPATDPHLVARYDAEDAANKGRCKASLLSELELSLDPERPLFVSLGPVSLQKGSDLLADAIEEILRSGAQLVIAGAGDAALERRLEQAVASQSDNAAYLGAVSDAMTHRLVAAADAVLLPSRFEPCGQVQQCAQRYGAAPVAHAAGGLVDTIVDCDARLDTGTGFLFDEPTAAALTGAVQRAVSAMRQPAWGALRRRMMRLDRSWERAARRYARLYRG